MSTNYDEVHELKSNLYYSSLVARRLLCNEHHRSYDTEPEMSDPERWRRLQS